MSTIAVKKVKLGDNADTSKNFLIEVPAVADGTLTIKREDGTAVLSIAADGVINLNAAWQNYTPVLEGGTTAGVGTYGTREGEYIDLGSMVFFRARVDWTAHTGTGSMNITLPTTASDVPVTPLATYANGVNVGANNTPLFMVVGAQRAQLYGINNVSGGAVSVPSMDTAGSVAVSGWYRKA